MTKHWLLKVFLILGTFQIVGCSNQPTDNTADQHNITGPSDARWGDRQGGGSSTELDEPDWDQFIVDVMAAPIDQRQAMVDSFITMLEDSDDYGFPLTVGEQAVFLYTGTANSVAVPGDHNGWDPGEGPMSSITGTNLFHREYSFPLDARLDYKFVLNGSNWILDPRNPRQVSGGFGPNSELAMPAYIDPPEIEEYPNIPHGTLDTFTFSSDTLNNTRTVRVYLPPGYSGQTQNYPVIYVHDGGEYITLGSMNNVLDYCIDQELIDPVIAVFVNPVDRNTEYWLNSEFKWMFVNELVPYIDANYRTIQEPTARAIMGPSLGGVTAVYIAHEHPDVFGMSAGQSSALWINGNEIISTIAADDPTTVAYYLDAGTFEGDSIFGTGQQLRDVLLNKGNFVEWNTWNEGHSWGNWRAHIDNVLITFFASNYVRE